jgi:hypothetical protein
MPTASTRVPGDAVSIAPGRWTRPWFERRLRPNARTPALFADTASFWRMVAQAATIVMAVLMLGAFLYFAHAFVVPVLCAFVVGMTLGPVLAFAARRGIPAWLTAVVIVVLGLVGLYLALITLAQPVSELIARAPELGTAIKDKLHILDRPFAALHELQVALGVGQTGQKVEVGQSRMVDHRDRPDHRSDAGGDPGADADRAVLRHAGVLHRRPHRISQACGELVCDARRTLAGTAHPQ